MQLFWEISTLYKAINWTASKACGQNSYQQHSRSKSCMPKAKKFNILPAIFSRSIAENQNLCTNVIVNFLGFLFPFRIRIPKKYWKTKSSIRSSDWALKVNKKSNKETFFLNLLNFSSMYYGNCRTFSLSLEWPILKAL